MNSSKTTPQTDAPYKVLYDGDCSFCRDSVALLTRLDKNELTEPVPLSEKALEQLKVKASFEDCAKQMHIVSRSGQMFVGYFAIIRLASLFPQTKVLAWLASHLLPPAIGCALYRLVANNRYLIKRCDNGQCKLK